MSRSSSPRSRSAHGALVLAIASLVPLGAQEPFPAGTEGQVYYCPRIDLNPASDGGPLSITLDGYLDEPAWQRAHFQGWSVRAGEQPTPDFIPPEEDLDLRWAAVADSQYLYVAWKAVDETRIVGESSFCNVWEDDSVELYVDALADGPVCPSAASCYGKDDAQITIGADQIGKNDPADPELLEFGGVAGGGTCDFVVPAPEVCRGVIQELEDLERGLPGWQGEVAIALDTLGNGGDGTPEWHISPEHGTVIGFNIHLNDDDSGAARDHKLIWSLHEVVETSWQNPGAFGRLQFVIPDRPLAVVRRDLPDGLLNGGTGLVTITVTPTFGEGRVIIEEDLPPGLVPSAPSTGGVLAGNGITWDLGTVTAERTMSYTITASPDAADGALPGRATIDGEPLVIIGDIAYSGSPITADGFIKSWLHLGPLAGASCDPGPDLALDWIVAGDGSLTEETIKPFPGLISRPGYWDGVTVPPERARSTGLKTPDGLIATDRFPHWKAGLSATDTVDHASLEVHGFGADDHLTLSCVYVTNTTGAAIPTRIGLASDDAVQVWLGDQPVWENHACRGYGNRGEELDVVPPDTEPPLLLPPGESRVLVKVADGGFNSGFRLRFRKDPDDPAAGGLLPPDVTISLESREAPPALRVARSLSPESYHLGESVEVSLAASPADPSAPMPLRLLEALPAEAVVADISDGGTRTADGVEWDLSITGAKTVSYRLVLPPCSADFVFGASTWSSGSFEALVGGAGTLRRAYREDSMGLWNSRDIGTSGGSAERIDDGSALLHGRGAGLVGNKDEFRFVSRTQAGNFELVARIDCFDDPGARGLAGVMVRDTDDPHSAFGFLHLAAPVGTATVATIKGSYRSITHPNRVISALPVASGFRDVNSLPVWLGIRRTGTRLSFVRSDDGVVFNEVGFRDIGSGSSNVSLREEAFFGLAATGGGSSVRAVFSGLSGFDPPAGKTFRRGDSDASGSLDLSDAIGVLQHLFLGAAKPACWDAADTDDNGAVDISDPIANLQYQFLGGAPPAAPGPQACGADPSAEDPDLGCDTGC